MIDLLRWFFIGIGCGLVTLLSTATANSQSNFGASYLGMCHSRWKCQQSLDVFQGVPEKRVRWLATTFGKQCPCVKRFLGLPGRKLIVPHLVNGTCFKERGRICGKDEPFFGESIASADSKLKRKRPDILRRYRKNLQNTRRILQAADADTEVLLSLCLECPLSDQARLTLLEEARLVFPDGKFVDSVLSQKCLPGLVCEKHGRLPRLPAGECIADTDGDSFDQIDMDAFIERTRQCRAAFLWAFRFNLLDVTSGSFQPPLERSHPPTADDLEYLRYWLLEP